ncbi:hypothetical protein [Thalassotalea euphylliae]|nr:hypothetical protein [Thalassotalea euphylliae]
MNRQRVKQVAMMIWLLSAPFVLTGCASTLLMSALQQDQHATNQAPTVNHQVLNAIQSLRALQAKQQPNQQNSAYQSAHSKFNREDITFEYPLSNTELAVVDRLALMQLLNRSQALTLHIAPAKANSLWQQLSLTQKRVAALQAMAAKQNRMLVIEFQPSLADDTLLIKVEV